MRTWHVNVSFISETPFTEEAAFTVTDELEDLAAVMSVSRAFTSGSTALTINAETITEAGEQATRRTAQALTCAGIDASIVAVLTQTEDELDREIQRPVYPEVVGYAEIARLAGVSRQRARQFADIETFPAPVIETAQGPLYDQHAITHWLENRKTRAAA